MRSFGSLWILGVFSAIAFGCLQVSEKTIPDAVDPDVTDVVAEDEGATTPPDGADVGDVPADLDSPEPAPDAPADGSGDDATVDVPDLADPAEDVPSEVTVDLNPDEGVAPSECGNSICEKGETAKNCFEDCHCGDGICQPDSGENSKNCKDDCCICGDCLCNTMDCGEKLENCPSDCSTCGDHLMSPGESPKCCPLDACWTGGGSGCGDGICMGPMCGEDPQSCPQDCSTTACGNQTCEKGENPFVCAEDCLVKVCGNGSCEPPDEDPLKCPNDCGPSCGDCECKDGENFVSCPVDCGYCGDGICSHCLDETVQNCPKDCA